MAGYQVIDKVVLCPLVEQWELGSGLGDARGRGPKFTRYPCREETCARCSELGTREIEEQR